MEELEELELKELVAEASRALARLDADRLEELALSARHSIGIRASERSVPNRFSSPSL